MIAIVLCLLGFGSILALLVVLWQLGRYYRDGPEVIYGRIRQGETAGEGTPDEGEEQRPPPLLFVVPPGWLLLPWIPLLGLSILDDLLRQIRDISVSLQADPEVDPPKMGKNEALQGGDCILLAEQYDVGSGEAAGMRLEVLKTDFTYLVSGRWQEETNDSHIPVDMLWPVDRKWATIKREGKQFVISPFPSDGLVTVRVARNGEVKLLKPLQHTSHTLQSGDRVLVGMSDYQFIQLPHLVLREQRTGKIVCSDVERARGWKSNTMPGVEITQGEAIVPDASWYQSPYPVNEPARSQSDDGRYHIRLQPGDWLQNPDDDQSRWVVGYAKTE